MRERTPETGAKFRLGWLLRRGHVSVDLKAEWEVGRFGQFDPTDAVRVQPSKEIRGVVSYYYGRHNMKVQAALSASSRTRPAILVRESKNQGVPASVPDRLLTLTRSIVNTELTLA